MSFPAKFVTSTLLPWDRADALRILPPRNDARYAARRAVRSVLRTISDEEQLWTSRAVALLQSHDWSRGRGGLHGSPMLVALARLRREVAQALWRIYAPCGIPVPACLRPVATKGGELDEHYST